MTVDAHGIFVAVYRLIGMVLYSIVMDSLCSTMLTPRLGSPNSHLLGRFSWFLMLTFLATFSAVTRVDMFCLVSVIGYATMPYIAYKGRARMKILTMDLMLNMICITECIFLCFNSVLHLELEELNKRLFVWNDVYPLSNIFDLTNTLTIGLGSLFFRKSEIRRTAMPEVKYWEGSLWSIVTNLMIYTAMLLTGHGMIGMDEGTIIVAVFAPMSVITFGLQLSYMNNAIYNSRELERVKEHYGKLESELKENKDKQRRADEIYRIEHDMKNHLAVVEMLNMTNDYERIESYAQDLIKQVESGEFIQNAQWSEN